MDRCVWRHNDANTLIFFAWIHSDFRPNVKGAFDAIHTYVYVCILSSIITVTHVGNCNDRRICGVYVCCSEYNQMIEFSLLTCSCCNMNLFSAKAWLYIHLNSLIRYLIPNHPAVRWNFYISIGVLYFPPCKFQGRSCVTFLSGTYLSFLTSVAMIY